MGALRLTLITLYKSPWKSQYVSDEKIKTQFIIQKEQYYIHFHKNVYGKQKKAYLCKTKQVISMFSSQNYSAREQEDNTGICSDTGKSTEHLKHL